MARSTPLPTTVIIMVDRRRPIILNGATTRATEPLPLNRPIRDPLTTPPLLPMAPTAARRHGSTTTSIRRRRSSTAGSHVTQRGRTPRTGTLPRRRIPHTTRRGTRATARHRLEPRAPLSTTPTDGASTTVAGMAEERRRACSTPTAEGAMAVTKPVDPLCPPRPRT